MHKYPKLIDRMLDVLLTHGTTKAQKLCALTGNTTDEEKGHMRVSLHSALRNGYITQTEKEVCDCCGSTQRSYNATAKGLERLRKAKLWEEARA